MPGLPAKTLFGMMVLTGVFAFQTACAEPAQPLPRHTAPLPLDAPSVQIGNGLITAKIYLPDAQKGFYRGTRFDQTGVIGSLVMDGQNFYGPWFDRVSPEVMVIPSRPKASSAVRTAPSQAPPRNSHPSDLKTRKQAAASSRSGSAA